MVGRLMHTEGRLGRAGFLLVALPSLTLAIVLTTVLADDLTRLSHWPPIFMLQWLFALAALPIWPAMIRRLHDTGRRGASVLWCLGLLIAGVIPLLLMSACETFSACQDSAFPVLVGLVTVYVLSGLLVFGPPIAFIVALTVCFFPSQPGSNRFGPPPGAAP